MGYLEYCSNCGTPNERREIDGRLRRVCPACGTIHYENPRPAVTVIAVQDEALLLVKRAEPPAVGYWCLPGGYMELGENPEDTARRELEEETALHAGPLAFVGFCPLPGGVDANVLVCAYYASEVMGTLLPGDDASDAQYFPINDLPPVAFPCHQILIDTYLKGRS